MKKDKALIRHPNINKRICTTCAKPLLYRDKHGNVIKDGNVKRTLKKCCHCYPDHGRGFKARRWAQEQHNAQKKHGDLKRGIAARIAAKDPQNIDRSQAIAREKKSRKAHALKMKDPLTNPNWVKSQKDKERKKLGN